MRPNGIRLPAKTPKEARLRRLRPNLGPALNCEGLFGRALSNAERRLSLVRIARLDFAGALTLCPGHSANTGVRYNPPTASSPSAHA
jgi:hypothetical protein